ncbi:MAG: plastocyanin/azurin family copper-binding protein [Rudaea sp.]
MKRALSWCVVFAVASSAHAATTFVNVGGQQNIYTPQTVTIEPGDSVTFVNKGGFHNVVADDGSFRCARGCDGDGQGGNGGPSSSSWVVSVHFPQAGRFGYFCEVHGTPGTGMFGTVIVQAPPPPVQVPVGGRILALLAAGIALIALLAITALRRKPRRE